MVIPILNTLLRLLNGRDGCFKLSPAMYALTTSNKKLFLRKEGGYCTLMNCHEIRWFNHWITATETSRKIEDRMDLEPIESQELLYMLHQKVNSLVPELFDLMDTSREVKPDEELFREADSMTTIAALRGGMQELRDKRDEDARLIGRLREKLQLQEEAMSTLMISVRDYERLVVELAEK